MVQRQLNYFDILVVLSMHISTYPPCCLHICTQPSSCLSYFYVVGIAETKARVRLYIITDLAISTCSFLSLLLVRGGVSKERPSIPYSEWVFGLFFFILFCPSFFSISPISLNFPSSKSRAFSYHQELSTHPFGFQSNDQIGRASCRERV